MIYFFKLWFLPSFHYHCLFALYFHLFFFTILSLSNVLFAFVQLASLLLQCFTYHLPLTLEFQVGKVLFSALHIPLAYISASLVNRISAVRFFFLHHYKEIVTHFLFWLPCFFPSSLFVFNLSLTYV